MYTTVATGTIIMTILLALTYSIVNLIAQWKFFKKAGRKGWETLIPFYNTWVLIKIAGLNWWYFLILITCSLLASTENIGALLLMIGIVYYIMFIIYYNIAKKTKQNPILYGLLAIFVPYIPILILGLSKNITYNQTVKVSPNGPFGKIKE